MMYSLSFMVLRLKAVPSTETELTEDELGPGEALTVTSRMNDRGVIFGDGIEDDSITVTVANGAVVRAYPPEWEHLVKLARSICDGLYIVRVVASSLR